MDEALKTHGKFRNLTRREVVQHLGIAVATSPFIQLLGCSSDDKSSGALANGANAAGGTGGSGAAGVPGLAGAGGTTASGATASAANGSSGSAAAEAGTGANIDMGANAGAVADAGSNDAGSNMAAGSGGEPAAGIDAGPDGGDGGKGNSPPWATGGTTAMAAKDAYPSNPFTKFPQQCPVSCDLTLGPCFSTKAEELQDISYGNDGLPLRVYLRVLNKNCEPVPNALVDVWHTSPDGEYTNQGDGFWFGSCTSVEELYDKLYFRGKGRTNNEGIVFFDTCYPGWYPTRANHIHFRVALGNDVYVTTQFGFDEALNDEIFSQQPLYSKRGPVDVRNEDDILFSAAANLKELLFETQKMPDKAMLAYKTVMLRDSLDEPICSTGIGI
jgi:protocatechuate 3,4-dioxygenase beta subunit